MAHAENYDVRTIKFEAIVPKGEADKLVMVLQEAHYVTEPIKQVMDNRQTSSYQLVRHIRSFYSSFLAENGWIEGLVEQCPGFTECIFALSAYLLEFTRNGEKDLSSYSIDCGDTVAGDLVFYLHLKR